MVTGGLDEVLNQTITQHDQVVKLSPHDVIRGEKSNAKKLSSNPTKILRQL